MKQSRTQKSGSPKHTFISMLVILAKIQPVIAQACHFTDGSQAPTHSPCNSTASVSHCCDENGAACLTNGLVTRSHHFLCGMALCPNILLVLLSMGSILQCWHMYGPFLARQQLFSVVSNNPTIPESRIEYLISLR